MGAGVLAGAGGLVGPAVAVGDGESVGEGDGVGSMVALGEAIAEGVGVPLAFAPATSCAAGMAAGGPELAQPPGRLAERAPAASNRATTPASSRRR